MNKKHDNIEAFRASQRAKKEAMIEEIIEDLFGNPDYEDYLKSLCFEVLWTRKGYELKQLHRPKEFQ